MTRDLDLQSKRMYQRLCITQLLGQKAETTEYNLRSLTNCMCSFPRWLPALHRQHSHPIPTALGLPPACLAELGSPTCYQGNTGEEQMTK